MRLGAVLRKNLYEAPYNLGPQYAVGVDGDYVLATGSSEPCTYVEHNDKSLALAVLQPQDYGPNLDPASDLIDRAVVPTYDGVSFYGFQGASFGYSPETAGYTAWRTLTYKSGGVTGYGVNTRPFLGSQGARAIYKPLGWSHYWETCMAQGPKLPAITAAPPVLDAQGSFLRWGDPIRIRLTLGQGYATVATWSVPNLNTAYGLVTDIGNSFDTPPALRAQLYGNDYFSIETFSPQYDLDLTAPGSTRLLNDDGLFIDVDANGNGPYFIDYAGHAKIVPPGDLFYTEPNLVLPVVTIDDNPALQEVFKNSAVSTSSGFVFVRLLAYEYFAGQALTPVLLDMERGLYFPVQLTPQTGRAARWIAETDARPTMMISQAGYLLALGNSDGDQATRSYVFHTQQLALDFPPLVLPPTPALDLPCYNPAFPNITLGD